MSDNEKRTKIAERCGWTCDKDGNWFDSAGCFGIDGYPSNYRNDLNAMHEAFTNLSPTEQDEFNDNLIQLLLPNCWQTAYYHTIARALVGANARNHADAFLLTMGEKL